MKTPIRVEIPTIPELVVKITGTSEGLYALTSYGKMWRLVDATGYSPEEWCPVDVPPLENNE